MCTIPHVSAVALVEMFRNGKSQKIPYLLVYGPRDVEAGTVSVRLRDDTDLGAIPIAEFIEKAGQLIADRSLELDLG